MRLNKLTLCSHTVPSDIEQVNRRPESITSMLLSQKNTFTPHGSVINRCQCDYFLGDKKNEDCARFYAIQGKECNIPSTPHNST